MGYKPIITDSDKQDVLFALRNSTSPDTRMSIEQRYLDRLPPTTNGDCLCNILKITRRKLRFIVHEINSDDTDHLILTDTDEGGYWLAVRGADPEPAVRHYWEEESRAMRTLEKVRAMKRKIVRKYGADALDPMAKLQGSLF